MAFSCLGTTLKAAGSKEKQWKVDFDYQYEANIPDVGTFVIDIKIDPKAKWEIVTYNNVMYRVAPVHEILYYKAKYAKKGNIKHINDIKNILKYGV